MPEGDAIHRAAMHLQVLAGQRVEVETPHPRAAMKGLAERLDGRLLESVEAVGKNVLLRFEGGLVLRSHLRMSGRWRVERRGASRSGRPWLILRGDEHEAVLWNGPVLELARDARRIAQLGPDILTRPPDFDAMLERLRAEQQARTVGDAVLDQRLVAGIGNMWKAEALLAVARLAVANACRCHKRGVTRDARRSAPPDARPARGRAPAPPRLSQGRPCLPPLRRDDSLVSAGRERPDGLLVSRVPKRRQAAEGVVGS